MEYRRWGDVSGLLDEIALHRLDPNRPLPDTGELQTELAAWAKKLIVQLSKAGNTSLLKAADTNCLRNRRAEVTVPVKRAQARGKVTPTVQQVLNHLIAPIVLPADFGGERQTLACRATGG